jgi:hypothetical protein
METEGRVPGWSFSSELRSPWRFFAILHGCAYMPPDSTVEPGFKPPLGLFTW